MLRLSSDVSEKTSLKIRVRHAGSLCDLHANAAHLEVQIGPRRSCPHPKLCVTTMELNEPEGHQCDTQLAPPACLVLGISLAACSSGASR